MHLLWPLRYHIAGNSRKQLSTFLGKKVVLASPVMRCVQQFVPKTKKQRRLLLQFLQLHEDGYDNLQRLIFYGREGNNRFKSFPETNNCPREAHSNAEISRYTLVLLCASSELHVHSCSVT